MCFIFHDWLKFGPAFQFSHNSSKYQSRTCHKCGKIQTKCISRISNMQVKEINESASLYSKDWVKS